MDDERLIERGIPCHQIGAETQRERGASSALPPLYFLHVWWARRPLTPSRAAIAASLLPADTDPEEFVRQLGIERVQALVSGVPWTLTAGLEEEVEWRDDGTGQLAVTPKVLREFEKEEDARETNRAMIEHIKLEYPRLTNDQTLLKWERESQILCDEWARENAVLKVQKVPADPAWFKRLMAIGQQVGIRVPNLYGYDRAFKKRPSPSSDPKVVLDPTAGGGSIPFEALRLGHKVIANELNPVAATILHATLEFPARFGPNLSGVIERWGNQMIRSLDDQLDSYFGRSGPLPVDQNEKLEAHLRRAPELIDEFAQEDVMTYLYVRQVICPHCQGEAPLLNTNWLSKEAKDPWGVRVVTDGKRRGGKVTFEPYCIIRGKGPNGEDPEESTVTRGVGRCVHCEQAIDGDEIKAQARGESPNGTWKDQLYIVVAIRLEPQLDRRGKPVRYATGERAGNIKTKKVRFFRAVNARDQAALKAAADRLQERWEEWDRAGLIPTERYPGGFSDRVAIYGVNKWTDMFTSRQLLGHLTVIESLNTLKPEIIAELGEDKGRAVVTYLQFAIDKVLDYNSRQTRWEYTRGVVKGTFGRHDFSLKWTFGELILSGPKSGLRWGLSQILESYSEIAALAAVDSRARHDVRVICGSASHMHEIGDATVDLVCMDPPYYDNVQYGELSDYFYHWQRRTLQDLYPQLFARRRGVDTQDEAVANPHRAGSSRGARDVYEGMMAAIFRECRRVLKDNGMMTLMFTHKSLQAWETLTQALIESGWIITSSFPVESESSASLHQRGKASAASAIFLSCRKRLLPQGETASWTGFAGKGVQSRIASEVRQGLVDFEPLHLGPVDQMIASYGRALRVLSERWPVLDGNEPVSPLRAMAEASRVVAEAQVEKLTGGRIAVGDLDSETAMCLTIYDVWGHSELSYDELLNLSRSLNISVEGRAGGYHVDGRMVGLNREQGGRNRQRSFDAPLVRNGSKVRLARPQDRTDRRLEQPQTDWDIVHGTILAYRQGDMPVARAYLEEHAADKRTRILDLLQVWAREADEDDLRLEGETILFGLRDA
jgi:putative DNA methylase